MALPNLTTFPIVTTANLANEARSGLCPALSGEVAPFTMDGLTVPPPPVGVYPSPSTEAVVSELGLRRAIRRHYDGSVNGYNLGIDTDGTGYPFRDASNKIIKTKSIVSKSDKIKVYEESDRIKVFYDNTSFTADLGKVQGGVYQMWGSELFGAGAKGGSSITFGDKNITTRFTDPAKTGLGYEFDIAIAKICVRIPKTKAFSTADMTDGKKIFIGTSTNFAKFGYFIVRDTTYLQANGEWVPFVANPFYGRKQYEYFTVPEGGPYPTWTITAALNAGTSINFGGSDVPASNFEIYIFFDMVRYS